MAQDNPLAARARNPQPEHPMMGHARIWQHVSRMAPHEMPGQIEKVDRTLPILGGLAGNPKVTAKDVIKAAANATANGITKPDEAVKFITQIPSDPDKVQPWLKGLYAANLSMAVHLKAAAMQQAQGGAPQVPQQPQPMPAPQMPPQGGMPNG